MARRKTSTDGVLEALKAFGLAYPGAHSKSPWPGHDDLAVNDKTFAYLSVKGEPLAISCKLPRSNAMALSLPFTKPTAYGLGKSGWVSATFDGIEPPLEMLKAWIDESYRAQAPKRLVAQLDGAPARPAPKQKANAAKKAPARPAPKQKASAARKAPAKPAPKQKASAAKKAPAKRAAARKAAARG